MKIRYITFIVLGIFFSACQKSDYYMIEGNTQGTTYKIIYEESDIPIAKADIDSVLRRFDLSLSTYIPESLISQINQAEKSGKIDSLILQMFRKAEEVHRVSGGMFDITVAPLINAYGMGFTKGDAEIDSARIDSILQFVGMDKVQIKNDVLIKEYPQTMLDGNAIAQGLAVDFTAAFLEQNNVHNYLVEIGGEVLTKGNKFGRRWVVAVDKPIEGSDAENRVMQRKLFISDKAMATSGNYRKFTEIDGKKFTHSINPKTGYPTYHKLLSVTIIADDCMTADAYATACMVSGMEKAKKMLAEKPDLDAYFIYEDENGKTQEFFSEGMKKYTEEKPAATN